jgi:hypothetical protein
MEIALLEVLKQLLLQDLGHRLGVAGVDLAGPGRLARPAYESQSSRSHSRRTGGQTSSSAITVVFSSTDRPPRASAGRDGSALSSGRRARGRCARPLPQPQHPPTTRTARGGCVGVAMVCTASAGWGRLGAHQVEPTRAAMPSSSDWAVPISTRTCRRANILASELERVVEGGARACPTTVPAEVPTGGAARACCSQHHACCPTCIQWVGWNRRHRVGCGRVGPLTPDRRTR